MLNDSSDSWQSIVAENPLWGTGTVIQDTLGVLGLSILVIALTMEIFTGLNGFTISTSRLLFAMARAKIIPSQFSRLHPKYNTPYFSIIFTVIVAMIAPWFGREVLLWVVDMSSIGVTIAYFYTCYTAFHLYRWSDENNFDRTKFAVGPGKKLVAIFGMMISLVFLSLLLIPGSPAFLGTESRIALVVWIVLGVVIYLAKRKSIQKMSEKEMNYQVLGEEEVRLKNQ